MPSVALSCNDLWARRLHTCLRTDETGRPGLSLRSLENLKFLKLSDLCLPALPMDAILILIYLGRQT